jgi:hypothetical protein
MARRRRVLEEIVRAPFYFSHSIESFVKANDIWESILVKDFSHKVDIKQTQLNVTQSNSKCNVRVVVHQQQNVPISTRIGAL